MSLWIPRRDKTGRLYFIVVGLPITLIPLIPLVLAIPLCLLLFCDVAKLVYFPSKISLLAVPSSSSSLSIGNLLDGPVIFARRTSIMRSTAAAPGATPASRPVIWMSSTSSNIIA